MNLLHHHFKEYSILWALERILEVDFIINQNTTRHQLYRDLTLLVVRYLLRCQEVRDRERFVTESDTSLLVSDSDEDIPDLVPNDID